MLQMNATSELLMSSTPASPLHNLWSIVLSRVGGAHIELFTIPDHLSAKQAYGIVKLGIPSRCLEPLSDHLGIGKGAAAGVLGMDRVTANRKVAKDDVLPTYAAESMLRL